ncbi:hypothetical protein WDU94_006783 [Cyamophila willieti]
MRSLLSIMNWIWFVLIHSLMLISGFEDNSKNIVLIQIYNLETSSTQNGQNTNVTNENQTVSNPSTNETSENNTTQNVPLTSQNPIEINRMMLNPNPTSRISQNNTVNSKQASNHTEGFDKSTRRTNKLVENFGNVMDIPQNDTLVKDPNEGVINETNGKVNAKIATSQNQTSEESTTENQLLRGSNTRIDHNQTSESGILMKSQSTLVKSTDSFGSPVSTIETSSKNHIQLLSPLNISTSEELPDPSVEMSLDGDDTERIPSNDNNLTTPDINQSFETPEQLGREDQTPELEQTTNEQETPSPSDLTVDSQTIRSRRHNIYKKRFNSTTPQTFTDNVIKQPRHVHEPSTISFLPRSPKDQLGKPELECSGILIKKDFVITTQFCLIPFTPDSIDDTISSITMDIYGHIQGNTTKLYPHIRIKVTMADNVAGFVIRSYQQHHLALFQVKLDNVAPVQYHFFYPQLSIPFGASLPAKCRVEGFAYTSDKRVPQYSVTELPGNAIFKHCPEGPEFKPTPVLLRDFDNILCKYNFSTMATEGQSLCSYLSGAGLFCPELQGILYMNYPRKTLSTRNVLRLNDGPMADWEEYQDDTLTVVKEILHDFNILPEKDISARMLVSDPNNLESNTNKNTNLNFNPNGKSSNQVFNPNLHYNFNENNPNLNFNFTGDNPNLNSNPNENKVYRKLTPKPEAQVTQNKGNKWTRRNNPSQDSSYCGTQNEVGLFINTQNNQIWLKQTMNRYSAFKKSAAHHFHFGYNKNLILGIAMLVSFTKFFLN